MKTLKQAIRRMEGAFSERFSFADESRRKLFMYYVMTATGLSALVLLGTVAAMEGDWGLGLIDASFGLILIVLLAAVGRAGQPERIIELTLILLLLFFSFIPSYPPVFSSASSSAICSRHCLSFSTKGPERRPGTDCPARWMN